MSDFLMVFCTCPDKKTAEQLAQRVVSEQLAACVNIIEGVSSVYRWQGNIETAAECLMIIKTVRDKYPQLEASLQHNHPYEVPEVVGVPIENGLKSYLEWLCFVTQ